MLSEDPTPDSIVVSFPNDLAGAHWQTTALLAVIAHAGARLVVKDPIPPPPGSFICSRRWIYTKSSTGNLVPNLQVLVCDKPCDDSTKTCDWADAAVTISLTTS